MLRAYWAGDSSNEKHSARSPSAARGVQKVPGDARLSCAGRAGDQHAAAAEISAIVEHLSSHGRPGRHAFDARGVLQLQRCDREHRDAIAVDQERILVGAVAGPAILHHAQPARGNLIDDAMIERDDAIRHVFFQTLAGQRLVALFTRDDGGDASCPSAIRTAGAVRPAECPYRKGRRRAIRSCPGRCASP